MGIPEGVLLQGNCDGSTRQDYRVYRKFGKGSPLHNWESQDRFFIEGTEEVSRAEKREVPSRTYEREEVTTEEITTEEGKIGKSREEESCGSGVSVGTQDLISSSPIS